MVNQTGKKHVLYRKHETIKRLSRDERKNQAILARCNKNMDVAKYETMKGDQKAKYDLVKKVIRETVGAKPYEHRIQEILKLGRDKPALRFAKARLGKISAAKKKIAEMRDYKHK